MADNLNDEVKEVGHFSSDPDAKTNTAMQRLITQEGINPERTSYVGTDGIWSEKWVISQGVGMTSYTMVSDNQSVGVKASGEQSINKPHAETFSLYGSISNSTSQKIHGAVEIVNVPDVADGHSEFTPVMAGPAKLSSISGSTVAPAEQDHDIIGSAELLYRLSPMNLRSAQSAFDPADGTWLTADQITDWSLVKAVAVSLISQEIPPYTTLRLAIPVKDQQIYHHVGKTIYVSSAIFSKGVEDDSGLPTLMIEPASEHSAKLKVVGEYDEQKLDVTFIDDTTGETLKTVTKTGQRGTTTDYTTIADVDDYVAKHYILVSDDTDGKMITFDYDDNVDQHYTVHLKHDTEAVTDSVKKNLVVHYVYADGQDKTGTAADDAQEAITFTRTGTHDLVTDTVEWDAWDQASQTFPAIASPIISGYTTDKTEVSNVSVTADSPETTEETVKYRANEQELTVDFIDDTTLVKRLRRSLRLGQAIPSLITTQLMISRVT